MRKFFHLSLEKAGLFLKVRTVLFRASLIYRYTKYVISVYIHLSAMVVLEAEVIVIFFGGMCVGVGEAVGWWFEGWAVRKGGETPMAS